MKYLAVMLLAPLALSAHAEMLYPKGARAAVTVEYSYQSAGEKPETPSDPDAVSWRVKRAVTVTATLEAMTAVGVPSLHPQEAQQKVAVADMQKRSQQVAVQTKPMMDAAMAAYEKCGDNEACIEREIKAMAGAVEQSDVKGAKENIAVITTSAKGMNDTQRYQVWQPVSQAPSPYTLDEEKNTRSREPGCMRNTKATCITQETIKGAGSVAGASNQASAMFEVDSQKGDMVITLPVPIGALPATFARTTDNPDLTAETKKTVVMFPSQNSSEKSHALIGPHTVAIKTLPASGTLTIATKGKLEENGTLTVKWRVTPL